MANFVFGDVQEITCTHNEEKYVFYPKANESFTIDMGGIRTNDDANQTTSDGQMLRQLNRVRWMAEGPIAVDTTSNNEMKGLNAMSSSPISGVWQFTLISGAVFSGTGSPVGDFQYDSNAGTLTLKVSGNRELQKVS